MSSQLMTFVGWSIVPNLATNILQSIYYAITIRAGDRKPAPGSLLYAKHYRIIRICLIVAYLFYTFYEASVLVRRDGDFYQLLGIPLDADERGIKTRFRRLAALHHPDKVASAGGAGTSEEYFVQLKLAQETLIKPAHRYAYDRFGPDIVKWQTCQTTKDFLAVGLRAFGPMYIGSVVVLTVLGVTGWLQWGRFWRYYLTALLMILEVYTVTRPYSPSILSNVINPILKGWGHPPLLQFQFLSLARSFMFTSFIGLSQLAPLLQTGPPSMPPNEVAPAQLSMLEQMLKATESEVTRLLGLELAPYASGRVSVSSLQRPIKNWLVQNTILSDPQVKQSAEDVIRRRQTEQPEAT